MSRRRRLRASTRAGQSKLSGPDGREGSVQIHQDVSLYAALLNDGTPLTHTFAPGRYGWLQVARGEVEIGGQTFRAGDGAAIAKEESVTLAGRGAEVLLFDLA